MRPCKKSRSLVWRSVMPVDMVVMHVWMSKLHGQRRQPIML